LGISGDVRYVDTPIGFVMPCRAYSTGKRYDSMAIVQQAVAQLLSPTVFLSGIGKAISQQAVD
jgi:hypothetical protein